MGGHEKKEDFAGKEKTSIYRRKYQWQQRCRETSIAPCISSQSYLLRKKPFFIVLDLDKNIKTLII